MTIDLPIAVASDKPRGAEVDDIPLHVEFREFFGEANLISHTK